MIAGFTGKMTEGIPIIRTFEIISGTPQMLLRHQSLSAKRRCADVGRTGQIGSCEVMQLHTFLQNTPGQIVAIGIQLTAAHFMIALVVSCPQSQRRMITQSFDLEDSFFLQPFGKLRLVGIDAAAHGKILPNQNAFSVTEIKKRIRFIYIAAPAAHHIAADVIQQLQRFG